MEPVTNETPADKPVAVKPKQGTVSDQITPEFIQDYLQNRVEQYATWYDRKCGPLKERFLYIKAVSVIGGALVPVLVNSNFEFITSQFDIAKLAATLLSLIVVILVSWDSVFQYGKQWKNYRSTEQFLRQEAVYFKHRTGFYAELDDVKAFRIFVERIENAIAQENAVTLDTLTRESNTGRPGTSQG